MAPKKAQRASQPKVPAAESTGVWYAPPVFAEPKRDPAENAWRYRWSDAVYRATVSSDEAAVVGWLIDGHADDFKTLRSLCRGRLATTDGHTLGKISALISSVVSALRENDADGVQEFGRFWAPYVGMNKDRRLFLATQLIETTARHLQNAPHTSDFDVKLLILELSRLDPRFENLEPDHVRDTLCRLTLKPDLRRKGGSGNTGPSHALAQLAISCGAFDASSARTLKKAIKNAPSNLKTRRNGKK